MLRRCALLVAAALSPTAALVLLAAPRAPTRYSAPVMGFFDQRKPDKMDVSYSVRPPCCRRAHRVPSNGALSQVAAILNKDPSAVGKLQSCIKAAEAALKSNPKAKKELGVYRYTDNIMCEPSSPLRPAPTPSAPRRRTFLCYLRSGYGEQGNTVKFRFFGIFSKRAPDVLIPGTNISTPPSSRRHISPPARTVSPRQA